MSTMTAGRRRGRSMPPARRHEPEDAAVATAPALPDTSTASTATHEVVVRVVGDDGSGGAGPQVRGRQTAPRTKDRSGFTIRGFLLSAVLGAFVVGLVLVAGVLTGLFNIGNPFSTTRVDRTPPALLKEMTNLSEFHAAQGTFQVRVDIEDDVAIAPSFLAGEHVLFDATGTVDATVDFSKMSSSAVKVSGDDTVTITLESPGYGKAIVDPARSSVVDRDRGLITRIGDVFGDDTNNERDLYLVAGTKVAAAAKESNLQQRAEKNTRLMLEGLLGRLGYTEVDVRFVDPTPAKPAANASSNNN